MSTAEEREQWRELAEDGGLFEGNAMVLDLLADVDRLTGDNASLSAALDTALAHLKESEAERDALAAELAQVRAQLATATDTIADYIRAENEAADDERYNAMFRA
jgi:vacuolar-type H+-ATPase subunit I/STV1